MLEEAASPLNGDWETEWRKLTEGVMLRNRLVSTIIKFLTRPLRKSPTWPYNDLKSLKCTSGKEMYSSTRASKGSVRSSNTSPKASGHTPLCTSEMNCSRRDTDTEPRCSGTSVWRRSISSSRHYSTRGSWPPPLFNHIDFTIRVCRPHGLKPEALRTILDTVIGHLGDKYDTKHIFDLARYFFPVSLIPRRCRKAALHLGNGVPNQVICSSLIGSKVPSLQPSPLNGERGCKRAIMRTSMPMGEPAAHEVLRGRRGRPKQPHRQKSKSL